MERFLLQEPAISFCVDMKALRMLGLGYSNLLPSLFPCSSNYQGLLHTHPEVTAVPGWYKSHYNTQNFEQQQ